jgi:hypothetical protein
MEFKAPNVLREYAAALNDDELKYLYMRLDQRFDGDVAEALLIMQRHEGIDNWLKSAKRYNDFFGLLDVVVHHFEYESKRRSR